MYQITKTENTTLPNNKDRKYDKQRMTVLKRSN